MDQFGIKKDNTNSFYRPSIAIDKKQRKIIRMTFEKRLKQELKTNKRLCFHGTPIWNAKAILKSGGIYSQNETDMISVSPLENVWFTIGHHADLLNFNYPAGCIFVIEAKDEAEYNSALQKYLIKEINFNEDKARIKAIITTEENEELVKEWVKNSCLRNTPQIVTTYDTAIDQLNSEDTTENLM